MIPKLVKRTIVIIILLLWGSNARGLAEANQPASGTVQPKPVQDSDMIPLEASIFKETSLSDLSRVDEPISMDEAVRIGLLNSQKIKLARTEIKIAAAQHKEASAKLWPSLKASEYTFLIGGRSAFMRMPPGNLLRVIDQKKTLNQEFAIYGKVPIFQPDEVILPIRVKRFSEDASVVKSMNTEVDVAYQVREDYLKVAYLQAQIAGLRDELNVRRVLLQLAEGQMAAKDEAFKTLQDDMHQAEAKQMKKYYELENALLDLKMSMGIDLSSKLSASDQLNYRPWRGEALDTLIQQALEQHPHLQTIVQHQKEAKAETLVAQSKLWPSLFAQASGNFRIPQNVPVGMANGVIGIFEGQLPVFDMTKYRGISESKAKEEKLLHHHKAEQLETAKNICQAWNNMRFEEEVITMKAPAAAKADEELQRIQGGAGSGPSLDADRTINQAVETRHEYLQSLYQHECAKSNLTKAVGLIFEPDK